ncbi:MAG TPA: AsmA-like C-terminal region-containing protein, partial [Stellaceae bacterium]|nr:AsmA-like C-terminal region-containing protein [Stellaceae bacterium]
VTVTLDGAYNGIPSQLAGETQGFATMRDSAKPFGLSFSLSGAASRIDFKGTLRDPLNFDGADGTLAIEGEDLGQFLDVFQAGLAAPLPYSIAGPLQRAGDHWQLSDAKGRLASSDFTGSAVTLQEGRRGQPDNLALDLRFPDLDLQQMLIAGGYDPSKPTRDIGALSLRLDQSGGTDIDASIAASRLSYGTLRLADLAMRGTLAAGHAALQQASFAFASGKIEASGDASTVPAGTRIAATARLSGLDASPLAELLGADAGQITGSVDGGATLEMTGGTVADALKTSQGAAVLAMRRGSVARSLLERASTDIRSLFRRSAGSAPVRCLLGVVSLHDGLGAVAPLRLATNEATLIGGGQLDLPRGTLDLTVKSHASGPLALDIPFRVSGDITSPSVSPVIGGSTAWLDTPAQNTVPSDLPPDLQQLAAGNPC